MKVSNYPFSLQILFLIAFGTLLGCNGEKMDNLASGYPEDIAPILRQSCAVSGCHNKQSAPAAGGLNLESWETLFEGSRGGSPIIPYSPDLSYLLYSVNTDSTLGPTLEPTMPFNEDPLTSEEYALLWNWIYDGARNANGEERFPSNSNRQKWYVGHQVCDEVAIIDAESRQIIRYIDVGIDPVSQEYVFDIKITPDGKDWFVVFFGGNDFISRYSTLTDEKITDIPLNNFGWSTLTFSHDSKFAFIGSEYLSQVQVIDLAKNEVIGPPISFDFETRGPTIHPQRQEVYFTEFRDQNVVVLDYDNGGGFSNKRTIDLVQNIPPTISGDIWPFEILFLPDGNKYFVSCTHSNEVRVLDGQTDSLLDVINLPASPSKMTYSEKTGRLFVSCMDDLVSWNGDIRKRGSIAVINSSTHDIDQTLYSGFQPYSILADDANGVLVVTNRNSDNTGPAPHHESYCEGRNGYITLIDLNTLELVPDFKPEVLADPSTIAGN